MHRFCGAHGSVLFTVINSKNTENIMQMLNVKWWFFKDNCNKIDYMSLHREECGNNTCIKCSKKKCMMSGSFVCFNSQ